VIGGFPCCLASQPFAPSLRRRSAAVDFRETCNFGATQSGRCPFPTRSPVKEHARAPWRAVPKGVAGSHAQYFISWNPPIDATPEALVLNCFEICPLRKNFLLPTQFGLKRVSQP